MSTPSLRRNGKPPACEPCRKSRLRCDHVRPSCGRCGRRGMQSQCIYHPAPMTRKPPSISISNAGSQSSHRPAPFRKSTTPTPFNNGQFPLQDISPMPTPPTPQSGPSSPRSNPTAGFLGSTSYAAVWTDQPGHLDPVLAMQHRGSSGARIDHLRCDQERLRNGATLLSMFRNITILEHFIEQWYRYARGLPTLATVVRKAMASIRVTYGDILSRPDNEADLLKLAEKICGNTSLSMKVSPYISVHDYAKLSLGENLRWEILGIIVTLVGASILSVPSVEHLVWNDVDAEFGDRKQFYTRIVEASNTSLTLVSTDGEPNDLLAWLLFDNFMLMTKVHGDNSSISWARMGELATAIYAMGLHQPIRPESKKPIFLAEARKIFLATVYVADKELATFLGRPPRVSKRYYPCQLPLDLCEEETEMEGAQLEEVLSRLDPKGWSQAAAVRRIGYNRIRMLTSLIREDILEISLGIDVENLEQRAEEITNRNREFYASLPPRYQYARRRLDDEREMVHYVITVIIYLDYLYSDFLVQRTLLKRTQTSSVKILALASRILSTVLSICAERDRLGAFQSDIAWEIAYYGLPSAGVLAVELLREHNQGESRFDGGDLPSRSETIQDLSVFISCLDWTSRLGIGNHVACSEARIMLKRIMDRILLPPPRLRQQQQQQHQRQHQQPQQLPSPSSGSGSSRTRQHHGDDDSTYPSSSSSANRPGNHADDESGDNGQYVPYSMVRPIEDGTSSNTNATTTPTKAYMSRSAHIDPMLEDPKGSSNSSAVGGFGGDLQPEVDFMTWLDSMDLDMSNLINFNALWDSTGLVNG